MILAWIIVQATLYPGLCEPTSQGGLGFDYFVNLSASEMWSSLLGNVPDRDWNMSKVLTTYHSQSIFVIEGDELLPHPRVGIYKCVFTTCLDCEHVNRKQA